MCPNCTPCSPERVHDLPQQLGMTLHKLGTDSLKIQLEHRKLGDFVNEFDRSSNRVVMGLITSALLVASALIIRADVGGYWLSGIVFAASVVLGVWVIWLEQPL